MALTFTALPRKLIYKIFVRRKEMEARTRRIACTSPSNDLPRQRSTFLSSNKRKMREKFLMRRFVRLRGFSKLRRVKYRTFFFVGKIYRVPKIIYIRYKSYLLLPSILSFHQLCIKRASSLFRPFLNKLIADVTHTIKTGYFSQSLQPFRSTKLFSN